MVDGNVPETLVSVGEGLGIIAVGGRWNVIVRRLSLAYRVCATREIKRE